MGIENLKRWHWMIIGAFVGAVIAWVNLGVEPSYPRTVGQQQFERDLTQTDSEGHPLIYGITVHPQVQGAYNKPVQILTFLRITDVKGVMQYMPFAFRAELPYKPTPQGDPGVDVGGSVTNYLKAMATQEPTVKFKYAWWEEPKWCWTLWTAGSVVVIGGIWPFIIQILIGAGLAKPPKPKEEMDLSRYGKKRTAAATPGKRGATQEDMDELERVGDAYEKALGAHAVAGGGGTATAAATTSEVKKLDGGPLEIKTLEQEQEEKDYKGEFYPVAHPKHHKDDSKPQ